MKTLIPKLYANGVAACRALYRYALQTFLREVIKIHIVGIILKQIVKTCIFLQIHEQFAKRFGRIKEHDIFLGSVAAF